MMVQTYSTIPIYQTSAALQIDDERSTSVSNLGVNDPTWWQESGPYYRTQYQILQSRELRRRVVRQLHLENIRTSTAMRRSRAIPITLVRQARASASAWYASLITRPSKAPRRRRRRTNPRRSRAHLRVPCGVQVRPVGDTRVVNVVYTPHEPAVRRARGQHARGGIHAQNLDLRLQNTGKTLEWVNVELEKATEKLKASEDALTRYREQNNAQSLDDRQNIVVNRLTSLNETVTTKRTERQQKETLYHQVKNADPTSDSADAYPLLGNNPAVVLAQTNLATLKTERATLAQTYGPDAPKMKDVETKIDAATKLLVAERRRVIDAAKNDYEAARAQEISFSADLERAKLDSMDLDRKSGDYKILQRDYDANQELFKSLLEQQKNLTVVANSRANNVRLMDRAEVPSTPIAPNPRRDWLTAILAGLTIAFGLAFGIEYLDDSVKTPEDITRRLRLPLLGLVPAVRGDRVPVLTETVPHDFGESFRIAPHVARVHERQRRDADHRRHQQSAARRQDDHGGQSCARAGARRCPRAAHRRRHAAAWTTQDHGPGEQRGPVTSARRAGACPRRHSAQRGSESVRDQRGTHAAESVRAARLRADERVHREPRARTVRLGRDRHAPRAGGDGRGHRRAEGRGSGLRHRVGDDPLRACGARARDAAERPRAQHRRRAEPRRLRSE